MFRWQCSNVLFCIYSRPESCPESASKKRGHRVEYPLSFSARARTAARPGSRRLFAGLLLFLLASVGGCDSHPEGVLTPVQGTAPGASEVEMLVATTRSHSTTSPNGVDFTDEMGNELSFAEFVVSIPPDGKRKVGEVLWPSSLPGNPANDFVVLGSEQLDLSQAKGIIEAGAKRAPGQKVLLYVHGYNTSFAEAVFRFAQIVHDSNAAIFPLLFSWASKTGLSSYDYDQQSVDLSRNALEVVLQSLS